jgi:hypothetical protein
LLFYHEVKLTIGLLAERHSEFLLDMLGEATNWKWASKAASINEGI